jgi:uncharacterized protein
MRSFQLLFWIVFLLIYTLITLGAVGSLVQLANSKQKAIIRITGILLFLVLILTLVFLYIWPGDVRTSENYSLYFFFNGILLIDFFFKIPLSFFYIVGKIFSGKNKRSILSCIGIIISSSIIVIILHGIIFGRNDLAVQHVELEFTDLPNEFNGYKIVQISDIHLGSFINSKKVLKNVYYQTESINPNLIVFTGDLVNNFSYELNGWDTIFQKINNKNNSYSILGNHDYGNYSNWENDLDKTNNFQSITDAHYKFGFQLLRNENRVLTIGTDSIYLIGVENWGHPPFPQYAELDTAMFGVPYNAFKILLSHDPAHWESQINGKQGIALTLSGHSHGLQLGFVKAGIPFSLSYLVRKNWGGLYKSDDIYLYVNTGLGTVGIPWRIDMPAELTVLTLKRVEVN